MSMFIARCKIDERGRLTLPKSFLDANDLCEYTMVYLQAVNGSKNTARLVFDKTTSEYEEYGQENK
tara:strand:+ start:444 stop:641 length:198 start_codon:yes stop_codon:yes gene_type:complete